MPSQKLGISLQILELLSDLNFPGKTRGEIRTALGLPPDTEITARVRELKDNRAYGQFDVRMEHCGGKVYSYWLPPNERRRAKAFLESWKARRAA